MVQSTPNNKKNENTKRIPHYLFDEDEDNIWEDFLKDSSSPTYKNRQIKTDISKKNEH